MIPLLSLMCGADERTRTAGLLITSELLYHLSYIGADFNFS